MIQVFLHSALIALLLKTFAVPLHKKSRRDTAALFGSVVAGLSPGAP